MSPTEEGFVMVSLDKKERLNIIGEVPFKNRLPDGNGEVVGTAKIEKTKGGAIIAHIDMSGKSADILLRGFSLGSFSIKEEDADDHVETPEEPSGRGVFGQRVGS